MDKKLVDLIQNEIKSGYKARLDNGNLINNIVNMGIKKYQKCEVGRDGEYKGLVIEALSDSKHLVTDYHIIKGINALYENDINKAVKILDLETDFTKYGQKVIHYTIKRWLDENNISLPSIIESDVDIDDDVLDRRIVTVRNDPINFPFRIVGIGQSKKGNSVVPESWMGKEFKNGFEFHREMDKLDSRKGKPPVSFCCTHSMMIINESKWINITELCNNICKYIDDSGNLYIGRLDLTNNRLITSIKYCNEEVNNIFNNIKKDKSLSLNQYMISCNKNLILIIDKNIFVNKPLYSKSYNVGLLVSRLQKCIRRGPKCSYLLYKTIKQLNISPIYNMPDQQFIRVSGTRQLLWRSFISIIEDECGYIKRNDDILDLLDILLLAIICNIDPNLQLTNSVIEQLSRTLLIVQSHNIMWNWRQGELIDISKLDIFGDTDNRLIDSMLLALKYMPMMYGDRIMLTKCIDLLCNTSFNVDTLFNISNYKKSIEDHLKENNESVSEMVKLVSYDMHCCPNILLSIQARIPFIESREKYTTQYISKFIWENNSKINYRIDYKKNILDNQGKDVLNVLKYMQRLYEYKNVNYINYDWYPNNFLQVGDNIDINEYIDNNEQIDESISRLGFLLLFGKKYKIKNPSLEVIIAGTNKEPCRIKKSNAKDKYTYLSGQDRFKHERRFIEQLAETIYIPKPPFGYEWVGLKVGKEAIIIGQIIKSNDKNFTNEIKFYVDDISLDPFDTSKILKKCSKVKVNFVDDAYILELLLEGLYLIQSNTYEIVEKLIYFSKKRLQLNNYIVYDWLDYAKSSSISPEIWRQFYYKVTMNISMTKNDRCEVIIGPVDRSGNKIYNSISYEYEGIFIRLLCLMSFLYPKVIEYKSELKFIVKQDGTGIHHMLDSLYELTKDNKNTFEKKNNIIKIKTNLWDHQKQTVDKIFNGFTKFKRLGFGDASHVGAGKSLSALSIISRLKEYNDNNDGYSAFLVMVPTEKLYKTWKDEIDKHTEGFKLLFQEANGDIPDNIDDNSVLVTTMGRMRDHPISHPWVLVCIDECLSVQNNNSLQTLECWRQVLSSKYGVIMMSATFFRSRFDKLFYMLKMLRTGLPETPEYLDTILSETMVCNITEGERTWTTNINKFKLSENQYKKYNEILKNTIAKGNEKTYNALQKYIFDNCDYVSYFRKIVEDINSKYSDRKILIYSRSKDEADVISNKIDGVSRYPDKTKRHVVMSYAEGTFGLNDLTLYDTIITRIPDPDKIPQMKGRLDRPGQNYNQLYLEYIMIENTIEEASLYKLQLENIFRSHHIMPLAEFYKIALNLYDI